MRSKNARQGFTLVELMIVMVIIGILLSLILKATMGGIRTAELKATESLVAKLEQAMTDRMDALTTYRADPTPAHYSLAALNAGTANRVESTQRAQVIAQIDYLRAQLPDVFTIQNNSDYPLNFAGEAFGGSYQLPIGNSSPIRLGGSWRDTPAPADPLTPGTGIYGAAYEIAGGVYKQLGVGPKGYDGSDNDFDGMVDELNESLSAAEITALLTRLSTKHTHKTARSEMLYAILVEGGGTYGSSFDKDDFTSKEVQDTDGDGLMEFVDAWGEPLQFYRWPILYRSDSQKGFPDVAKLTLDAAAGVKPGPYSSAYESREQNPLDPNQTLLAPAWWGASYNASTAFYSGADTTLNISGAAATFMAQFGPCLVDPVALSARGPSNTTFWDRSTVASPGATGPIYARRAYYSRFLILSAGPDKLPGVAQLGVNYHDTDERDTIETPSSGIVNRSARDGSGTGAALSVANLLIESQGGKVDPTRVADSFGKLSTFGADGRNDTSSQLEYYGQDDITNHNLQATGGSLR